MATEENKDIADMSGCFYINIYNVCAYVWSMGMTIHCTGTKSSPDVTTALFCPFLLHCDLYLPLHFSFEVRILTEYTNDRKEKRRMRKEC